MYVLNKGTVVKSQKHSYRIEGVLGQGGFGITYKVVNEYNQTLALKEHFVRNRCFRGVNGTDMAFFDTASDEVMGSMKEFIHEGELLLNISYQCPNIVKVFEVFEANNTAYYSMEYLAGGSLRDLVRAKGPQKEEMTKYLLEPIATALTYLHGNRYLHRDIKPDNIVMRVNPGNNMMTPVLIDFGVSLHFDDKNDLTTTHHVAGVTRGFSPIEQYEPVNRFEPTLDIYSLAATWFYLLAGQNPLAATDITPEWIPQKLPNQVSNNTRNAIVEGMRFRANERPKNINAFLRLFDGLYQPSPLSPPLLTSPSLPPQKSPLLKRLIIALCALAAVAGIVIFSLNNCGGGEKASNILGLGSSATTKIKIDTLPPKKETFPRYYEMIDSIEKDTLYICIDSLKKVIRVKEGCRRSKIGIFDHLSGHLVADSTMYIYVGRSIAYKGLFDYMSSYEAKEGEDYFKMKVTEIEKELFEKKMQPPPKIETPIVPVETEEVEKTEESEEPIDPISNNPDTSKTEPLPPSLD